LGLQEIGRRIEAGDISPVELTRHMLDRIARIDATLESYATLMADQALAAAARAEGEIHAGKYRGPLHGVPIGVKDLCYTRGVRTMGGTAVLRDFVPDVDAAVVTRLQDAGAIILGKLNLTEGAMGGYHPDFGVPRNPWDVDRWPGRGWHRYRRVDSLSFVRQRRGRPQAHLRPRQPLWRAGTRRVARSRRPDGAPRRGRGDHVRRHGRS
jgi:hypothetical protein